MIRKLVALTSIAISLNISVPPTFAQSDLIAGEVKQIDSDAGKITLKHGPIKKLDMDQGMTMAFRVQDPSMLSQVKVGDKVQFDADRVNGQITITKIQKAK